MDPTVVSHPAGDSPGVLGGNGNGSSDVDSLSHGGGDGDASRPAALKEEGGEDKQRSVLVLVCPAGACRLHRMY